ncbi:MAG TPA: 1-acyl-sn-glycerol-3-phosphate acyltransferase, partial [Candidatus Dormibacteraeota bacterium]|nr:1-acyl-sn-glycerol-3-phosphate acyltransferase [Candidatus Dormibacteraeota bacterium]
NERLLPKQRVRGHMVWPGEDFPRGPTGKVRKGLVRERALALEREGAAATGASGVRRLLASLARVRPNALLDTTRLADGLGFASLDLVELAAAFEEEFGVPLAEERLGETTVGDLERLVRAAASGGESPLAAPRPPAPGGPETGGSAAGRRHGAARARRGSLRMPRWAGRLSVRLARRVLEETVLVPFVRLHARPAIAGLEHLREAEPPYLFVCNHRSFLDTGVFKAGLPRPVRGRIAPGMTTRYHRVFFGEAGGGAARYLKEWAQVRLVEFFFNAWPLPETAGFRRSLAYAGELMDRGQSLLIFPEGRHVMPPVIDPFRQGVGIFARELRAPVIPACIEGTDFILPNGRYWPRLGRARLVLGPPLWIDPEAGAAETTRQIETAVRRLRQSVPGAFP